MRDRIASPRGTRLFFIVIPRGGWIREGGVAALLLNRFLEQAGNDSRAERRWMDGCARSPANTSINHSDETWGGEKFLALRAATVVRKATKTMALTGETTLCRSPLYIYIHPSVPFCSFLFFFFFSFPFLSSFVSFSISRPTDLRFSLRSTRGKLTATLIPWLFFFFFFRNLAAEIYRCIRNKGEINCGVKVGNCRARFVVREIVKRESFFGREG